MLLRRPRYYTVSIIGKGFMCKSYLNAIHKYNTCYGRLTGIYIRVLVVCATDNDKTQAFAAQWGIPHYTTDVKRACQHEKVNGVVILTPPKQHVQAALWAAEAGKNVHLEKPVSHVINASYDIANAIGQNRVRSSIGYCYVTTSPVQTIAEFCGEGRIADPSPTASLHEGLTHAFGEFGQKWGPHDNWRMQGGDDPDCGKRGDISDLGGHTLSCMWATAKRMGSRLKSVNASTRILIPQRPNASGQMAESIATDAFCALVGYGPISNDKVTANGCVHSSRFMTGEEAKLKFSLYGGRGAVSWDLGRHQEIQLFEKYLPTDDNKPVPTDWSQWREINDKRRGSKTINVWGGSFIYHDFCEIPAGLASSFNDYFAHMFLEFFIHNYGLLPDDDLKAAFGWDDKKVAGFKARYGVPTGHNRYLDVFDAMEIEVAVEAIGVSGEKQEEQEVALPKFANGRPTTFADSTPMEEFDFTATMLT